MTEAGWTRPKEVNQAGWYWLRRVGSLAVVEVIAVPGYEPKHWTVEGANLRWSLGNMDGEFLGPITPTDRQQGRVEGLAKAVEIIKANTDVKKAIEIIRLHSLAQAQDEKGVGDGN